MLERVSVDESSGFVVNWGGEEGRMPLSFVLERVAEHDHAVSIVAVRVLELAHLLVRRSHPVVLACSYGNDTWSTEHGGTVDPVEVAADLGIEAFGYRMRWGSQATGPELLGDDRSLDRVRDRRGAA